MKQVEVRTLGAPQVFVEGQRVSFRTRKVLALLIYLVVEQHPVARARLVNLLWPSAPTDRGRMSLRSALALLRDGLASVAIDPSVVVADTDVVELVRDAFRWDGRELLGVARSSSVEAPGSYAAQAALMVAPFLDGFTLADAPAYEEWVEAQRARLLSVQLQRLTTLIEGLIDEGAVVAAHDLAAYWVAQDQLNEQAHRRLIEALLASGDYTGALRAYELCRSSMEQALGVAPAPETQLLGARAARGSGPLETRRRVLQLPPLVGPMVGRGAAFARLTSAYRDVVHGGPQLLWLEGELGIGKTRLGSEFATWASAQGADVLVGSTAASRGRVPYQLLISALRPRIDQERAPDDLLPDIWLSELSRLLPELRDRYPDLPAPLVDEPTELARLLEAVTSLVRALAARAPVVWLLDDLQFADTLSLDGLRYLLAHSLVERVPLLLLVTVGSEALVRLSGVAASLPTWLMNHPRELPVTRVTLEPLTRAELGTYLTQIAGGPLSRGPATLTQQWLADWLHEETGGHPLYLTRVLHDLCEQGLLTRQSAGDAETLALSPGVAEIPHGFRSPRMDEAIRRRLRLLSSPMHDLLLSVAVLHHHATFTALLSVAEVDERTALGALDELVGLRLLCEHHEGAPVYRFVYARARAIIYADASLTRRTALHRRAYTVLTRAGVPEAELAEHLSASDTGYA